MQFRRVYLKALHLGRAYRLMKLSLVCIHKWLFQFSIDEEHFRTGWQDQHLAGQLPDATLQSSAESNLSLLQYFELLGWIEFGQLQHASDLGGFVARP